MYKCNEKWNHYDYLKMSQAIVKLIQKYPFIRCQVIGKSVLDKPIFELKIGTGQLHTHFNASIHGNEWITSALLMKCVEKFAQEMKENSTLLSEHCISIVPMVNPDGVDLVLHGIDAAEDYKNEVLKINNNNTDFSLWKANIHGVDLNKQFPAKWEEELAQRPPAPHYRDYPGKSPISECEVIALIDIIKQHDFKRIHAFHTQGEEIYWGFDHKEPTDAEDIVLAYGSATGYRPVRYLNNFSGLKDWFIQAYGRPGFTIEFGKGENPLPFEQFPAMFTAAWAIFQENLKIK